MLKGILSYQISPEDGADPDRCAITPLHDSGQVVVRFDETNTDAKLGRRECFLNLWLEVV